MTSDNLQRCAWDTFDPLMLRYHDEEWGVPLHDDIKLFEAIVLDGAQAGLSWRTILHKREGYRRAFQGFDPAVVAAYGEADRQRLLADAAIVRNRQKIESAINNARRVLEVQRESGSLDRFLWQFTSYQTLRRAAYRSWKEVPATSPESDAMSAELRRRGFTFVGSTICYALMQATGMVNDHLEGCFRAAGRHDP
ncbi:MAG: DNA-3-methyladenine glycosylase I [Chloroflexi bacterium]|nr:DNA-3-methyladenine glycosylase I [Chloroflexota bacterium]